MNINDLDAIRKLTDAATEEPWFATVQRGKVPIVSTTDQALAVCGSPGRGAGKNAEFIAAARTLVPDLCDEVEQLRAERDQLVAYNRSVKGANGDLRAELAEVREHLALDRQAVATLRERERGANR